MSEETSQPIPIRKFEFGTQKRVKVLIATENTLVCVDDENEGYILSGVNLPEIPSENDRGVITFVPGGPMGGHWEYRKGTI